MHTIQANKEVMDAGLGEGYFDEGFGLTLEFKLSDLLVFLGILPGLLVIFLHGEGLAFGKLSLHFILSFASFFNFEVQICTRFFLIVSLRWRTVAPVSIYIDITEALEHRSETLCNYSV